MKKLLLFLGVITCFTSCKPTMEYVWSKEGFQGKKFNKLAVIAVSDDNAIRAAVEGEITDRLSAEGIATVEGFDVLPPNATRDDWKPENISKKLQALNVDGVIAIALVNVREREEYVPGTMRPGFGPIYYGYGRHLYRSYDMIYSPGYYRDVKEYVVEASLYDTKDVKDEKEALIWLGQSKLYNPRSLKGSAASYADNVVKFMKQENVLQ